MSESNLRPSGPLLRLTSYDLIKAAAVIIMIIDHFGYYLFPEEPLWRAIGRIGFPVWFFLIGYARSRDFSRALFIGAVLLIIGDIVTGMAIFPLSALVTIMLIRAVIDPLMRFALKNVGTALLTLAIVIGTTYNSFAISEYGTLGLLLAMFGYMARHKPTIPGLAYDGDVLLRAMGVISLLVFIMLQHISFNFQGAAMFIMMGGTALVVWLLCFFRARDYPVLTARLPRSAVYTVQLLGRNTLEIYVIHLLLLKLTGVFIDPSRFAWFDWVWYSATGA